MRVSILACVLSAVAAICIYACIAHLLAARHPWFRTVHLTFAAVAALAAVHALAHIAVYASQDVGAYLAASSYSNLSGAIAMAILPWLVRGYFGGGPRIVPSLLSVLFLLSAGLNEFAALGSSIRPMPILEQIVLPWAGRATIHRVSATPLAHVLFWTVTSFLLVYVATLAVRRHRRGNRHHTIAMVAAIAILALAIVVLFPLWALLRGFGGNAYPSAATRLWVLRPFWYAQLFLPLLAASGLLGTIGGLPFGSAVQAGRWSSASGRSGVMRARGVWSRNRWT